MHNHETEFRDDLIIKFYNINIVNIGEQLHDWDQLITILGIFH